MWDKKIAIIVDWGVVYSRVGDVSKPHVSTPKSFTYSCTKVNNEYQKWYLKVNDYPLIGFLVLLATTALRASAARSGSKGDIIAIM